MIGPATVGMLVFEPLTTDEHDVLSAHLTSGWRKQRVLYGGIRSDLWLEIAEMLSDLNRHFYVAFDRETGGQA